MPSLVNADGYEAAGLLGCVGSQGQCFLKGCPACDHMIGRKNGHDGCVIASCHPTRAERHGGSGVAFGRLRYDVFLWKIPEQLPNCVFLFGVRKD